MRIQYQVLFVILVCLMLKISAASVKHKGGIEPISVDDSGVKNAANATISKINKHYNSDRALILIEIEEAKHQVVSGHKYILHLKVGETNCPKGHFTKKCKVDDSRDLLACGATVIDKPWLKRIDVEYNCDVYEDESSEDDDPDKSE